MSSPTPRTQARRGRRRSEIVEAAERLLEARGGRDFTTEELAVEADIGQASVFYYFKGGRAEIDAAIATRRLWRLIDAWRSAVGRAPDGTAALTAIVHTMQKQYARDPELFTHVLDCMMRGPWADELIDEHVEVINRFYDEIEARLVADEEAGRIRDEIENLRRYANLVVSMAQGVVIHASMIRAAGGTWKHTAGALFDDLIALIERGTRL